MKLHTLISENPQKRFKLLITETQLRALASSILSEQEQGTIKKTYLVKQERNGKKR